MKIIDKIMDGLAPNFEADGKFGRLHHLFQAMDTFLRAPITRPLQAPLCRDPMDVKRYMSLVILALVPAFLASLYFFGWRMLLPVLTLLFAMGPMKKLLSHPPSEQMNELLAATGRLLLIYAVLFLAGLMLWG